MKQVIYKYILIFYFFYYQYFYDPWINILFLIITKKGVCFIETSSLDGEKNLKPKSAIGETLKHFSSY